MPKWMIFMLRRKLKKQLHGQGMGRHSTEEITQIMLQDLEALSTQLGRRVLNRHWLTVRIIGRHSSHAACMLRGLSLGVATQSVELATSR